MKPKLRKRPSLWVFIAYRVLVLLIMALAVFLLAGTIFAFVRSPDSGPLFSFGKPAVSTGSNFTTGANISIFYGLGRLRIPLADSTLILSITFPYSPDDRIFAEELAARIGDIKTIAVNYFSSLPPDKTVNLDEEEAKIEILRQINTMLRLGKIEALYFDDLMIID